VTAEKSDFEENNINVIFFYKSGCQAIENIKIKIIVLAKKLRQPALINWNR